MADTHVLSALVTRRSELAGEIEHSQLHTRKLIADLEHLDATILQFNPDYRVETIKPKGFRPPSDWASRGEMSRAILSMLRQAKQPMTTKEVALAIMENRGLDAGDEKLVRKMTKRCGVALRAQRENGLISGQDGDGLYMMWQIVRKET